MDQNGPRVRVRKIVNALPRTALNTLVFGCVGGQDEKRAHQDKIMPNAGDNANNAQHCGNPQHHMHIPCFGLIFIMNIIIGDGQDGTIVEQCQHHDHDRGHGIKVKDQYRQLS